MDEVYDSCVWGTVPAGSLLITEYYNGSREMVTPVDYTLGAGTMRPYPVRGRILMIQADTFDIVAFYLLRQLYKFYFPMIITFKYSHIDSSMICQLEPSSGIRYIITKIFNDRPLHKADYYPANDRNFDFRRQLCRIIFFCKLIGCPLSLHDIRVLNGFPFFWRCTHMGLHNARTVTEEEFSCLFGISIDDARRVYVGQSQKEVNASTLSEAGTSHYPSLQIERTGDSGNIFGKVTTNQGKKEHADVQSPMLDAVVEYFRDAGFEPDLVRACLYLKENPVRSAVGNRAKFKLANSHRTILKLIEENFSLLFGPYPFKVFRRR